MSEKIELNNDLINHCIDQANHLVKNGINLKQNLVNGSDFNKIWAIMHLQIISDAQKQFKYFKEGIRLGALIANDSINQCERSKSYLPEEGFVNNGFMMSKTHSCKEDIEDSDDTQDETIKNIFKSMGRVAANLRRAREREESEAKQTETPDFVKEMLSKIKSGELA